MTWWLWLIASLWAALAVFLTTAWILDRRENSWTVYYDGFGGAVFWTIVGTAVAVAYVFLFHFNPGSDAPPPKTRTCTIQQMQKVWVGKTYENEWVCIGWEQQ